MKFLERLLIYLTNKLFSKRMKIILRSDENKIVGYLFRPRYPNNKGIIYCHGGFGSYASHKSVWARHFKQYGYTVITINYPGEGLSEGTPNRWHDDIWAVLSAVFYLRQECQIGDVCIMGASRGGFVALHAMANYYKAYQCCVAIAPPTELNLWAETTSVQEPLLGEILINLSYTGNLTTSSPAFYASQLTEHPLLLCYDKDDDIVRSSQGFLLMALIRNHRKNAEVELKLTQGYGHGLLSDPQVFGNVLDFLKRRL